MRLGMLFCGKMKTIVSHKVALFARTKELYEKCVKLQWAKTILEADSLCDLVL